MKGKRWMPAMTRTTLVTVTLLLAVFAHPAWLLLTAWCAIETSRDEEAMISKKSFLDLGVTAALAFFAAV